MGIMQKSPEEKIKQANESRSQRERELEEWKNSDPESYVQTWIKEFKDGLKRGEVKLSEYCRGLLTIIENERSVEDSPMNVLDSCPGSPKGESGIMKHMVRMTPTKRTIGKVRPGKIRYYSRVKSDVSGDDKEPNGVPFSFRVVVTEHGAEVDAAFTPVMVYDCVCLTCALRWVIERELPEENAVLSLFKYDTVSVWTQRYPWEVPTDCTFAPDIQEEQARLRQLSANARAAAAYEDEGGAAILKRQESFAADREILGKSASHKIPPDCMKTLLRFFA